MCIIIDANKMGVFLTEPPNRDAAPIRDWVEKKGGRIIYSTGGKFANEIRGRARERLRAYVQSGMASQVDEQDLQREESSLINDDIRSDDPHVLALARASKARLLYTDDADLIKDFGDKRLIDKPRGKVYSAAHARTLLTRSTCGA